MALDSHKLSLSAALTADVAYMLCTVFCYFWPQLASDLMASMFHLRSLDMVVTWRSTALGTIQYIVYTYVLVYLWTWLYNVLKRA